MSAISILGVPSETYTYGLMYVYSVVAFIPAMFFAGHVYIPVFYNLKLTSAYEVSEDYTISVIYCASLRKTLFIS